MTRRKRWLIWIAPVIVLAVIGYHTGWWDKAALFSHSVMALGLHSTVVTPVHDFFVEMFSDPTTTAAVVSVLSACFAFGTLLVQLYVGSRQAKASRISADAAMLTAQSSGNRAVASMRIKWVEELREVLSEYHSILMSRETFQQTDKRRLSHLGTKLDLMMNLNEADQKALWDIAEEIYDTEDLDERRKLDKPLMSAGRVVLKNEWEKIKRELRGDVVG